MKTSDMVVPFGATAFITNRTVPKGGVRFDSSALTSKSAVYQIGSRLVAVIMGIVKGITIIIRPATGIARPKITTIICMITTTTKGERFDSITNFTRPWLASVKVRIWLKAVDEQIISNIMAETRIVLLRLSFIDPQLNFPYAAMRIKEPKQPVAAASDGVAIPNMMTPVTRNIRTKRGRIYFAKSTNFSDREAVATL